MEPIPILQDIVDTVVRLAFMSPLIFWKLIDESSTLAPPWNWLFYYYYWTLKAPATFVVKSIGSGFAYLWRPKITPFPNLNLVIGLVPSFLFIPISIILIIVSLSPLSAVGRAIKFLQNRGGDHIIMEENYFWLGVLFIYGWPAIFSVIYWGVLGGIGWLFAR